MSISKFPLTTARSVVLLLVLGCELSLLYLALAFCLLIGAMALRKYIGMPPIPRSYWTLAFVTLLLAVLYARFVV